jgi:hypothetical protein
VQTIAIPTVLAAFNWPRGSNRYARVERLADHLFSRLETLQGPGFHPKWKDVVLNAQVPGLTRFRGAQDWLDRTTAVAQSAPQNPPAALTLTPANERLYREFLVWRKNQQQ